LKVEKDKYSIMRPPRAGFSSMMSQGQVLPHITFVNEMMEYYTSRIEQNELQISFSSTFLLSALSFGLVTSFRFDELTTSYITCSCIIPTRRQ
jgi:hypothetical protein